MINTAKKSPEDQNEIPFLEKFMVSQTYDIFRFGGEEIKNDEVGIQRMLQNFSGLLTEEQIRENMKKYNLPKMFELVKEYFKKEYDFEGNAIQLNNRYQKTINSYIYNDQKNPTFIHIDELFESTVISFFVAMFKWSKEFDNLDIYGDCFRYTLFLMNDVCIFGEMQGTDETCRRLLLDDCSFQHGSRNCTCLSRAYWQKILRKTSGEGRIRCRCNSL